MEKDSEKKPVDAEQKELSREYYNQLKDAS